jgi:hypothetical protein
MRATAREYGGMGTRRPRLANASGCVAEHDFADRMKPMARHETERRHQGAGAEP